jgi:hypothetical protein
LISFFNMEERLHPLIHIGVRYSITLAHIKKTHLP